MAASDFFSQYAPYAQSVSRTTGIDPRIVLAQAALETGYGRSAPNFNLFGIKGKGATLQTKEFVNGGLIDMPQEFRTYESPEESFLDYAKLMGGTRYEGVRSGKTLEEQVAALQKSGYATDPDYGKKIMQIAKGINLEGLPMNGNTMQQVGAPLSTEKPDRSGGLLSGILGNQGSISGSILGGLGMNEDQADRFRMAILAGTGDPRMAPLIQATQARMQERKAKATTQGQINKTVQWLSSNNRQDLANLVMQGLMTPAAAVQEARAKPEQVRGIEVDGNILNPYTGEIIYQAPPKGVEQKQIVEARKEFTGLKSVKDFADVTFAYSRVVTSAQDPSPAGDLALIFNYMKVLDPGSVVREGEFATAQNAGGVDDRVRSLYNRVVAGTRLSEPQRADFVDRAGRLYQGAEKQYKSIADQYSELAEKAGLPVDQVIPDFTFKGTVPERSTLLQVPANPDKSRFPTDDDWKTHWQTVMTEDQRREYLEG